MLNPRDQAIIDALVAGATLETVASTHGVSKQRIHQIVVKRAPTPVQAAIKRARRARTEARHAQKAEALRDFYIQRNLRCAVCGVLVMRSRNWPRSARATCRADCAQLYRLIRHRLYPEEQRARQAQTYLKHPERCTTYHLRWARRYVAGEAARRTIRKRPDSLATEIMQQLEAAP